MHKIISAYYITVKISSITYVIPDCNVSIWRILVVVIPLINLCYYTYGQQLVGQLNQSTSQGNVTTNLTPQQQRFQAILGAYVYGVTT
jgi:hypothetical protein